MLLAGPPLLAAVPAAPGVVAATGAGEAASLLSEGPALRFLEAPFGGIRVHAWLVQLMTFLHIRWCLLTLLDVKEVQKTDIKELQTPATGDRSEMMMMMKGTLLEEKSFISR